MRKRNSSRGNHKQNELVEEISPFSHTTNLFERGTILAVDATKHVYHISTNSGRTVSASRIKNHPGDMSVLPTGTMVVISYALGSPYIFGVLPLETSAPILKNENPESITDIPDFGGNDPVFNKELGATARGENEPRDIMPGDFVGTSIDGASVSALHGQVAQLRASSLSKVQAFGENDLVQIICGVFRQVSWMGESKIVNNDGKTSFIWRGGTNQLTQTGGDEERYTIKLDVGSTGNILLLEICNRNGQNVFKFHVDPTGRLEIYAAGGIDQYGGINSKIEHPQRFQGDVNTEISGNTTTEIALNEIKKIGGSIQETISSNIEQKVGQDVSLYVNRDLQQNIGNNLTTLISGKTNVIGLDDLNFEAKNGHSVTLKTTTGTINQNTNGGNFNINTNNGTIAIQANLGTVNINGTTIKLGDNAVSHVVKFEELNSLLQPIHQQINTMGALLATHIHPIVSPTATGPSPVLLPLATAISIDISGAMAKKVFCE